MKNKERIEKLELAIDNLRMHVHQLHDELYEEVKENKEIAKNDNDAVKLQIADMVWDGKVKRASEDKDEIVPRIDEPKYDKNPIVMLGAYSNYANKLKQRVISLQNIINSK